MGVITAAKCRYSSAVNPIMPRRSVPVPWNAIGVRYPSAQLPYTGLCNRNQLSAELAATLANRHPSTGIAVIFVDINGFHRINEDFDFETGNLVLAAVAERLSAVTGADDLLARLDADSFVLVRAAPQDQCVAMAEQCVADIHSAFREPVVISAVSIPVRLNCGVAHHPADGDSAATLIRAARRAMESSRRD